MSFVLEKADLKGNSWQISCFLLFYMKIIELKLIRQQVGESKIDR